MASTEDSKFDECPDEDFAVKITKTTEANSKTTTTTNKKTDESINKPYFGGGGDDAADRDNWATETIAAISAITEVVVVDDLTEDVSQSHLVVDEFSRTCDNRNEIDTSAPKMIITTPMTTPPESTLITMPTTTTGMPAESIIDVTTTTTVTPLATSTTVETTTKETTFPETIPSITTAFADDEFVFDGGSESYNINNNNGGSDDENISEPFRFATIDDNLTKKTIDDDSAKVTERTETVSLPTTTSILNDNHEEEEEEAEVEVAEEEEEEVGEDDGGKDEIVTDSIVIVETSRRDGIDNFRRFDEVDERRATENDLDQQTAIRATSSLTAPAAEKGGGDEELSISGNGLATEELREIVEDESISIGFDVKENSEIRETKSIGSNFKENSEICEDESIPIGSNMDKNSEICKDKSILINPNIEENSEICQDKSIPIGSNIEENSEISVVDCRAIEESYESKLIDFAAVSSTEWNGSGNPGDRIGSDGGEKSGSDVNDSGNLTDRSEMDEKRRITCEKTENDDDASKNADGDNEASKNATIEIGRERRLGDDNEEREDDKNGSEKFIDRNVEEREANYDTVNAAEDENDGSEKSTDENALDEETSHSVEKEESDENGRDGEPSKSGPLDRKEKNRELKGSGRSDRNGGSRQSLENGRDEESNSSGRLDRKERDENLNGSGRSDQNERDGESSNSGQLDQKEKDKELNGFRKSDRNGRDGEPSGYGQSDKNGRDGELSEFRENNEKNGNEFGIFKDQIEGDRELNVPSEDGGNDDHGSGYVSDLERKDNKMNNPPKLTGEDEDLGCTHTQSDEGENALEDGTAEMDENIKNKQDKESKDCAEENGKEDSKVNVLAMIRLIESRGFSLSEECESGEPQSQLGQTSPVGKATCEERDNDSDRTVGLEMNSKHNSPEVEKEDMHDYCVNDSSGKNTEVRCIQPAEDSLQTFNSVEVFKEAVMIPAEACSSLPVQIFNALDGIKDIKCPPNDLTSVDVSVIEPNNVGQLQKKVTAIEDKSTVGIINTPFENDEPVIESNSKDSSPMPDLETIYDPNLKNSQDEKVDSATCVPHPAQGKDDRFEDTASHQLNQIVVAPMKDQVGMVDTRQQSENGEDQTKIKKEESKVKIGQVLMSSELAAEKAELLKFPNSDHASLTNPNSDAEIKDTLNIGTNHEVRIIDHNFEKPFLDVDNEDKLLGVEFQKHQKNDINESLVNEGMEKYSAMGEALIDELETSATIENFLRSNNFENVSSTKMELQTLEPCYDKKLSEIENEIFLSNGISKLTDAKHSNHTILKSKLISLESLQYNQESPDSGIMETSSASSSGNSESSPSLIDNNESFLQADKLNVKSTLPSGILIKDYDNETPIYSTVFKVEHPCTSNERDSTTGQMRTTVPDENSIKEVPLPSPPSKYVQSSGIISKKIPGTSYLKYLDDKSTLTSQFFNKQNEIILKPENVVMSQMPPSGIKSRFSVSSVQTQLENPSALKSCCKSPFKNYNSSPKRTVKFSVDYGRPTEVLEFYPDDSFDENIDPLAIVANAKVVTSQQNKTESEMIETLRTQKSEINSNYKDEFSISSFATAPLLQSSTMRAMMTNKPDTLITNAHPPQRNLGTTYEPSKKETNKDDYDLSLFSKSILEEVGQIKSSRTKLSISSYINPRNKKIESDYTKEEMDLIGNLLNLSCTASFEDLAKLKSIVKDSILTNFSPSNKLEPEQKSKNENIERQPENENHDSVKVDKNETDNQDCSEPSLEMHTEEEKTYIPNIPRLKVAADGSLTGFVKGESSKSAPNNASGFSTSEVANKGDVYSEAFEACLDNVSIGCSMSDSESSPEAQDINMAELASFVEEGQNRIERLKKTRDSFTGSPATIPSKKLTTVNRVPSDSDISTVVERERKAEILMVLDHPAQSYGTLRLPPQNNISDKSMPEMYQFPPHFRRDLTMRPHSLGNSPTHFQLMSSTLGAVPGNAQLALVQQDPKMLTQIKQPLENQSNQKVVSTAAKKQHFRSLSAGPSRPKMLRRVLPLPAQALLQQGGRSRSQTLPHPSSKQQQLKQHPNPLNLQSHQNQQFLSLTPQQKQNFINQVRLQNPNQSQNQGDYMIIQPRSRFHGSQIVTISQQQPVVRKPMAKSGTALNNPYYDAQQYEQNSLARQQITKRASLHSVQDLYNKHGQDTLNYQMITKQRPHSFYAFSGSQPNFILHQQQKQQPQQQQQHQQPPIYAEISTFNIDNFDKNDQLSNHNILRSIPEPDYPGVSASLGSSDQSLQTMPCSNSNMSANSTNSNNTLTDIATSQEGNSSSELSRNSISGSNGEEIETSSTTTNQQTTSSSLMPDDEVKKMFDKEEATSELNGKDVVKKGVNVPVKSQPNTSQSPSKRAITPPKPPPRSSTPPTSLPSNGAPEIYYTMDI